MTAIRGASLWAALDQALVSGTNFITLILVARSLAPAEFGLFVLAYSVLLFANSLQVALITQPHNVIGATTADEEYVRYTSTTALTQVVFATGCALTAFGAGAIAAIAHLDLAPLIFAIAAAGFAWQLQEFGRRVLYTEGRFAAALANDIVAYGGQALLMFGLFLVGALSGPTALYALAATSAAAVVLAMRQLRSSLRPMFSGDSARRNWTFGKWLLGTAVLLFTSEQIYPFLTAGLVSVASTGALRAAQTTLGPTNILLRTLGAVAMPRAARIYAVGGDAALKTYIATLYTYTVVPMGGYCVAVALFSEPVMRLLYGAQYEPYAWVVAYVAVAFFLTHLYTVVGIGITARRQSAAAFRASVGATVVALTGGVALVRTFGLLGAAVGSIAHAAVVSLMLGATFWRPLTTRLDTAVWDRE